MLKEDRAELNKFWQDKAHWSGGIYFCKEDPRLIVPKRFRWGGWTVNFGHKRGGLVLVVLVLMWTISLVFVCLSKRPS